MIKQDVWLDKLPEDKAKYYNRTRMSMTFFAQKLGLSPEYIIEDFRRNGYRFNEQERKVMLSPNPAITRLKARMTPPS